MFIDPLGLDFDRRRFYSRVVGFGMLGGVTGLGLGCATTGCVASGPAAAFGFIGGAVAGGLDDYNDQMGDDDGDGIRNHSDPYPGYPTGPHNDHDNDGIPDHDDTDFPGSEDCPAEPPSSISGGGTPPPSGCSFLPDPENPGSWTAVCPNEFGM